MHRLIPCYKNREKPIHLYLRHILLIYLYFFNNYLYWARGRRLRLNLYAVIIILYKESDFNEIAVIFRVVKDFFAVLRHLVLFSSSR